MNRLSALERSESAQLPKLWKFTCGATLRSEAVHSTIGATH